MTVEFWLLAILIAIAVFGGYWAGAASEHDDFQEKAVNEGHAEYYLDENNERQWRWKK